MMLEKLTIILIIFAWANDSSAVSNRLKRSNGGDYILHRCTATVQLIRKHRNEVNSHKDKDLSQQQIQVRSLESVAMTNARRPEISRTISSSTHRYTTHRSPKVFVRGLLQANIGRYTSLNFAH